jgi:hypothetical protein
MFYREEKFIIISMRICVGNVLCDHQSHHHNWQYSKKAADFYPYCDGMENQIGCI